MVRTTRRMAALMLALVFAFAAMFAVTEVPAYAAAKPAKVTGVKAAAISTSTTSLKVSWSKAKNAKKYEVYKATAKSGKYTKVGTTTGKTYTVKSLKANKKYFFKVKAVNGSKKSAFSAVASAKTRSKLQVVTINKTKKTATITCTVNGKALKDSTRHFIIDKNGFNKGKAMLEAYCSPKDLYRGLKAIGGVSWQTKASTQLKDGEKITKKNGDNSNFSHLKVTVTWDGAKKDYELSELLTLKKGGKKSPKIDMVFSGSEVGANAIQSGCVTCLDSCYIGIVSNIEYGLCVIDNKNPAVYGRTDILPKDGTKVKVTFTIK